MEPRYIEEEEVARATAAERLEAARRHGVRKADEAQALLVLARAQLSAGRLLEALQSATRGLTTYRELTDRKGEAAALYSVADVHCARGMAEEALHAAKESLKLFKDIGDRKMESATLFSIAQVRCMAQEYKEGLLVAQEALALVRALSYPRGEVLVLIAIARARLSLDEHDEALTIAREALTKCASISDASCEDAALDVLVEVAGAKQALDLAVDGLKAARDQKRAAGDKRRESAVLCKLSKVHVLQEESSSGVMMAKQAVSLAQEAADVQSEADGRSALAYAYFSNEDLDDASRLAEEAARLYRSLENPAGEAASLEVMINATLKKGDPDGVVFIANEALQRFRLSGDSRMQATMLLALAEVNLQMQDADGALVFYKKARTTFNEIKDSRGEASTFHKIARLCTTIGDADEATWSTQRATSLFRKMMDKAGEAGILLVAADMGFAKSWGFFVQGRSLQAEVQAKEALRNAELALSLFKAANSKPGQVLALLNVCNAQLMLKDAETALFRSADCIALCEELVDDHGRAGGLLLAAGAHLMEGRADAASHSAAEARRLFRSTGDGLADQATGAFLKDVQAFEAGDYNKDLFSGFYLRGADAFQPMPQEVAAKTSRREERQRPQKSGATLSSIQIFAPDGTAQVFFDGFEARQAGVSQVTRIRRADEGPEEPVPIEDEGRSEDAGARYRAEAPPVYAVRWQGIESKPAKPRPEGKATRLAARAEGPLRGLIDVGPVGAGTTFPPMFRVTMGAAVDR